MSHHPEDDGFDYAAYLVGCICEHDFHGWLPEDGCESCECRGYWEE